MKTQTYKRFVDPWWLSLAPVDKLVLDYVAENCDPAGLIEWTQLEWEFTLGLHKLGEQWYNIQNQGVIYETKQLCLDDTQNLGLDDTKIRRRPPIDWVDTLRRINTPPKEVVGTPIPQIVVIGECKWWYPRQIEARFGRIVADQNGGEKLVVKINENIPKHRNAVKILRAAGLLAKLREFYPELQLVEAPTADELQRRLSLAEKGVDDVIPDLESLLSSKEASTIPQEEVRCFFFLDQSQNWKRCRVSGWRAAIRLHAQVLFTKSAYLKLRLDGGLTPSNWPDLDAVQSHIEWCDEKITELNQCRTASELGPVLTIDAKEKICLIQAAQKLMREEYAT